MRGSVPSEWLVGTHTAGSTWSVTWTVGLLGARWGRSPAGSPIAVSFSLPRSIHEARFWHGFGGELADFARRPTSVASAVFIEVSRGRGGLCELEPCADRLAVSRGINRTKAGGSAVRRIISMVLEGSHSELVSRSWCNHAAW